MILFLLFLAFILLCVFGPIAIASVMQKEDFEKNSENGESYEAFCNRCYSHFI